MPRPAVAPVAGTSAPSRRAADQQRVAVERVRVGQRQVASVPVISRSVARPSGESKLKMICRAPDAPTRTGRARRRGSAPSRRTPRPPGPEPIDPGRPRLGADRRDPARPGRTSGPAPSGSTGRCRTAGRRPPGTGIPGSGARTRDPGAASASARSAARRCRRVSIRRRAVWMPGAEERVRRAADPQARRRPRSTSSALPARAVERERLLAPDVLAGLERLRGDLGVRRRDGQVDDDLDVAGGERLVDVAGRAATPNSSACAAARVRDEVGRRSARRRRGSVVRFSRYCVLMTPAPMTPTPTGPVRLARRSCEALR